MHPPVRLRPMGGDGTRHAARDAVRAQRHGRRPARRRRPHARPRHRRAPAAARPAPARPTWPRPSPRPSTSGRHLVVQAGTGTGKSLAYLVPAILSGRPTVVATATKALQDQLASKDLPFLAEHLDVDVRRWAVLKGRSNYLCLQRVREVTATRAPASSSSRTWLPSHRRRGASGWRTWAATTATGDRPSSTGTRATGRGPRSASPARSARAPSAARSASRASPRRPGGGPAAADVVVVNTHLYGLDLGSGGASCPSTSVVVIDEAHQLEDIISATAGLAIGAGRFANLARLARRIVADPELLAAVADAGTDLGRGSWRRTSGQLLPAPLPDAAGRRRSCRGPPGDRPAPGRAASHHDRRGRGRPAPASGRRRRRATLAEDLDAALVAPEGARGVGRRPRRPAPPGGGAARRRRRCSARASGRQRTAVLTSATVPLNLPERVGLPTAGDRRARRRQPVRLRGRTPSSTAPPTCPTPASPAYQAGVPRRARGPHHRGRRPHARPVHQLAGDAGGGRRAAARLAVRPC